MNFTGIPRFLVPVNTGVFIGVERWGEMVDVASEMARRARVAKARFIHARAEDIDWSNFDGFYLFNPYAELQWSGDMCLQPGGLNAFDYRRSVAFTKESLRLVRAGSRS